MFALTAVDEEGVRNLLASLDEDMRKSEGGEKWGFEEGYKASLGSDTAWDSGVFSDEEVAPFHMRLRSWCHDHHDCEVGPGLEFTTRLTPTRSSRKKSRSKGSKMSRKSLASLRRESYYGHQQTALEEDTMSSSSDASTSFTLGANVSHISTKSSLSMFTRSQCEGGTHCEAGCVTHAARRRRKLRPKGTESVASLAEEYAYLRDSEEEDLDIIKAVESEGQLNHQESLCNHQTSHLMSNGINHHKASRSRQLMGYSDFEDEDDEEVDEEQLTIYKRFTRVFRTSADNTSRFMDKITPEPVKKVSRSYCPSLPFHFLPLLFILLFLLPLLWYFGCLPLLAPNTLMTTTSSAVSSLFSRSSARCVLPSAADIPIPPSISSSSSRDYQEIQNVIIDLNDQVFHLKEELRDVKREAMVEKRVLTEKYDRIEAKYQALDERLQLLVRNCCRNETELKALIDDHLSAFWLKLFPGVSVHPASPYFASEIMHSLKQLARAEIESTLPDKVAFERETELKIEKAVELVLLQIKELKERDEEVESLTTSAPGNISLEEVKGLIREAITVYDADKTGLPDFALEPAGGTVINTRCSETYDPYGIQYKIAGIPVWSTSVSPRAVIQPRISPGECWAFRGAQGHLVMKLSQQIVPTSFTYEHIPKQISRDGNINSAPRDFQVRGLTDEKDTEGQILGTYEFLDNDQPLQRFPVQKPNPKAYQFIELIIHSNQGHPEYTCLYRFRVHGKRVLY